MPFHSVVSAGQVTSLRWTPPAGLPPGLTRAWLTLAPACTSAAEFRALDAVYEAAAAAKRTTHPHFHPALDV